MLAAYLALDQDDKESRLRIELFGRGDACVSASEDENDFSLRERDGLSAAHADGCDGGRKGEEEEERGSVQRGGGTARGEKASVSLLVCRCESRMAGGAHSGGTAASR